MEYRTSTPVAAGRVTANTTLAVNDVGVTGRRRGGRRSFAGHDNDSDDNNNNGGGGLLTAVNVNNDTTVLVDELEQLRTDNFQLRLRVYNAERRVDRLSAMQSRSRDTGSSNDSCSVRTTASSSSGASSSSSSDDDDDVQSVAAAKATAEAAVRTIHDLLTVNRRLLALLAATVSAKAVAVTADDKRRWQMLRRRIDHYDGGVGHQFENEKRVDGGESDSTTTRIVDVVGTGKQSATATIRRATLSPPPPPLEPPGDAVVAAADDVDDDKNDDRNGGSAGSELSRLRARCRRLERSLQQLVNTELWARNRQIGKLEQQRYVTQVQQAALARDERRAATPAAGRGILVRKKSSPETTRETPPPADASTDITTPPPPPVLPDYSEVNFFYSCDDEDELDDDDDDDQENDSEMNCTWPSTTAKEHHDETGDDNDDDDDDDDDEKEPVKLSATPQLPPSSQLVRSRKRQCRRQHRPQVLGVAVSSSAESVSAKRAAAGDLLQSGCDDVTTTSSPTVSRRRRGTVAGIGGPNRRWRQRCRPRRQCSTCGRFGGDNDHDSSMADAQVQCDGVGAEDGDEQLVLLRRELEARRRENCRLYEMLLTLQQGRLAAATSSADSEDHDDDGSPEPYRRAARTVRGRIADLLTAAGPATNDSVVAPTPPSRNVNNDQQTVQQQQQQLLLLARLRERIVAYERHELFGNDVDRRSASAADQENAVEHMDRAALVNVALPRAVDRLRRALVPLLHHKQKQQTSTNEAERPEQSSVG